MIKPQEFKGRGGLNIKYGFDLAYLMPIKNSIGLDLITTRQLIFWLSRYAQFREEIHALKRNRKNELPIDNSML